MPREGWRLVAVLPEVRETLAKVFHTDEGFHGRDHPGASPAYSALRLQCAWRVEHEKNFKKYKLELDDLQRSTVKCHQLKIRSELFAVTEKLPGRRERSINEKYLLHGTKPELVLPILEQGFNERFAGSSAGSAFGEGTYFADDPAKMNQYVLPDPFPGNEKLRECLFPGGLERPPANLHYAFLCRVVMGIFVETTDANVIQGSSSTLWPKTGGRRELTDMPGTRMPYHGLVVNQGLGHERFKEYEQFHGDRIYPEYLLAYQRI